MFARAVDAALEASVVGSFTRVGPMVRAQLGHWASEPTPNMHGRVVVITGATSGLGLVTAKALLGMGAQVEMVARNADKARALCTELRSAIAGAHVDYVVAEMGNLSDVRRAAGEIASRHAQVHVLVHNAGALDDTYAVSAEGTEQTVASQVVGPFLLTALLRDRMRQVPGARVLWVSSGGMYSEPLLVPDLEMTRVDYNGITAYARAKRAQVTLSEMLAERLAGDGIVVQCMHPGWADTPGVARSLPAFRRIMGPLLRTAEEGADTLVWLASNDGEALRHSGSFWLDRAARAIHRTARTRRSDTPEVRARLWAWVERKSGEGL